MSSVLYVKGVPVEETPTRNKPDHAIFAALIVPTVLAVIMQVAAFVYYGRINGAYTLIDFDTLTRTSKVVYGILTLLFPAAIGVFLSFMCLITFWHRKGRWWKALLLLILWGSIVALNLVLTKSIPLPETFSFITAAT